MVIGIHSILRVIPVVHTTIDFVLCQLVQKGIAIRHRNFISMVRTLVRVRRADNLNVGISGKGVIGLLNRFAAKYIFLTKYLICTNAMAAIIEFP